VLFVTGLGGIGCLNWIIRLILFFDTIKKSGSGSIEGCGLSSFKIFFQMLLMDLTDILPGKNLRRNRGIT
jgi:hypothetical protein